MAGGEGSSKPLFIKDFIMTFNEKLERDRRIKYCRDNIHFQSSLFGIINLANIRERKDKIKFYKSWFLAGNELWVNGSASGRVVLKYQPELIHLLKTGFIKQERVIRSCGTGQTVLRLKGE